MGLNPTNQTELAAIVQQLAATRPISREELSDLQTRCMSLSRYLATSAPKDLEVPEILWHFLSDADIRFKDPAYAESQIAGLLAAFTDWQAKSAV
jgi:hypothetical protein